MMQRRLLLTYWAFLALSLTAFAGCGGSSSTCEPGRQIECACAGGDSGFQQCLADGSGWGDCQCCQPDCANKECGPNGCDGSCGECTAPAACNAQGQCECVPDCLGKECGTDGCDGNCGICISGEEVCSADGLCEALPIANGNHFSATCASSNIAALIQGNDGQAERANISVRCEVAAGNVEGLSVPTEGINWLVEEGCSVQRVSEPGNDNLVVAFFPDCDPVDVEPMTDEPSQMVFAVIHNPRDGLLTIVFFTRGEEGYVDANDNGTYDQGEIFAGRDLPEPFVDADDNRERGDGSGGDPVEPFFDANGNGVWDRANGRWDADTTIWTSTRIMLTGDPDPMRTTFDPNNLAIGNCDFEDYVLTLVDQNLNPLASNGADNGITFTDCGGAITFSSDMYPLVPTMGVSFFPDGSVETSSFTERRAYQVRMDDGNCENPDGTPPQNCFFEATVTLIPAPAFGDYVPNAFTFVLPRVQGTVN